MQVTIAWDMSEVNAMMQKLLEAGQSGTHALVQGGAVVEAHAKMNAEGHGLHKTGNLVNSIQIYDKKPYEIMVGSRGVIYAAIHEFGGEILPKRAKFLHWVDKNGKDVFAKRVKMPMRPYLRPAFDENREAIKAAIANDIARSLS